MIRLNPQKIQKSKKQKKVKANLTNDLKAHFLSALKANPDFSEANLQLAQLYQEEGDNKNTDHHFKSAIASDSQQALDLENRGEELLKKFQFQNAKDQFMKAQEKKNHCAEVYYRQSIFFKNQNKTEAAQSSLRRLCCLWPPCRRWTGCVLRFLSVLLRCLFQVARYVCRRQSLFCCSLLYIEYHESGHLSIKTLINFNLFLIDTGVD